MSTTKDGGPAFPEVYTIPRNDTMGNDGTEVTSAGGMTLRQYYKAAALQGMLAAGAESMGVIMAQASGAGVRPTVYLATTAGNMADEMLAEDEEHAKK